METSKRKIAEQNPVRAPSIRPGLAALVPELAIEYCAVNRSSWQSGSPILAILLRHLIAIRRLARLCSSVIGMVSLAAVATAANSAAQGSSQTDTKAIVRLIDKWGEAVARCRADTREDLAKSDACGTVHKVLIELDDLGWCYGHESDPGPFFRRWHRCEFESLHPARP